MNGWLRNRVFLAADLAGWLIIPALALSLRLDGFADVATYTRHLLLFTILAVLCKFALFWILGMYRRYWRYASIDEVILIASAVAAAGVAAGTIYLLSVALANGSTPRLPRSVLIIDALLTLLFVGGSRFAVRAYERVGQRLKGNHQARRCLIVGAGNAGVMIARELHSNRQLGLDPVGFIDDDPLKHNRTMFGMPVLGGREDIPKLARELRVQDVIIAISNAPGRVVRDIRDTCESARLNTKIMPAVGDLISGRVKLSQIRNVQIEDLLRRAPVKTDQMSVAELVRGMTVLVTGAGGSIGSEICRQVAAFGARDIVLVGHGENSIFDVNNDLSARFPDVNFIPIVADVRNASRIEAVFEQYRPQAVFHAAAHKHVPLMEANPEEAVTNNVGGTMSILRAAERVGTSHFVFISTDKAVNPSSIMGATKLVAERLVHDAAVRTGAIFVSVRFGNVLASRGSVVPLFRKQIARGGPVTVTDPRMCRYFMTIPEAVQLVLQAAALGVGGETFVLDMGEPVKILDLAKDIIKLSGLEVDRDIEIKFTGLRPGEKMFEELFMDGEEFDRTRHEKIFVAKNGNSPPVKEARVTRLLAAASESDAGRLRHLLNELLPGVSVIWAESSVRHLVATGVGIEAGD